MHRRATGQLRCSLLAEIGAETWPRSATWHARDVAQDLETAAAAFRAAEEAVESAKAQVREAQAQLRAARKELHESIIADARGRTRTRMRDLVKITGLSREWIRQILRAGGIEPY
jgi:outer membrane protein TolC